MSGKETKEEASHEIKKSSNKLMIIIIAVLVLIIVGGVVVAFLLMGGEEHPAPVAEHVAPPQQVEQKTTSSRSKEDSDDMGSRKLSEIGILYPLDTFTVNLKSDAGRRYLKTTISLELNGKELGMELDKKAPVIRDRIIRILTSKTIEEISSKKGKQKISEQIIDTLNAMIADGSIKGIYFTEFVIQ